MCLVLARNGHQNYGIDCEIVSQRQAVVGEAIDPPLAGLRADFDQWAASFLYSGVCASPSPMRLFNLVSCFIMRKSQARLKSEGTKP